MLSTACAVSFAASLVQPVDQCDLACRTGGDPLCRTCLRRIRGRRIFFDVTCVHSLPLTKEKEKRYLEKSEQIQVEISELGKTQILASDRSQKTRETMEVTADSCCSTRVEVQEEVEALRWLMRFVINGADHLWRARERAVLRRRQVSGKHAGKSGICNQEGCTALHSGLNDQILHRRH